MANLESLLAGQVREVETIFAKSCVSSVLFWPDRQQGWARNAMQMMSSFILDKENTYVIITSGPIFSVHSEMCRWMRKNSGKVRWVMDFRDLWTNEIAPDFNAAPPHF